ncbi:glycosyltransferase family 4 protein [Chitinophaga nivalis]|uniref:Glycosyltransferase family 4 protein n=1 Tax=Chitinophaga nivalis TaxID=2991709 RepID=A0ABT3ILS4_9BACT|nr:glycosyltransferase family 1 protein [Chitinophaga nivalis]MCW3465404.1 glycosyltransferase family 4 protein [Chitinophaga nivalis]MCW3484904.1 glycosyltransferase family 4 protein [Chitinophaga nivalis]
MKIGIEAQRLFRPKKHGVEIVALELIKHLQQIDKQNEYYIFVKEDTDDTCITATENFHIIKLPARPYPIWEQVSLPRAIRQYRPDVLHCTANTAPLFPGVRTVITLHDVIFMESVNFKGTTYQNFGNLYRRAIVPRVARKHQLITVSGYEANNIIKTLGTPPEQVTVVHNGVSGMFRQITDPVALAASRERYKLPASFILFFANPAPKKNTPNTLAAFAWYCRQYPATTIKLVITDSSNTYIRQQIKELQLEDILPRLQILDYIAYKDLPAVYSLASLYLYPSLRESFGLPLLEAQACGTPVVTSNTSCMPEIAGDAAIFADPYDAASIGEAIAQALHVPAATAGLQERGFANARKYSWEAAAQKMRRIYEAG